MATRVAGARAKAVVHGSPQTIADMMEEWFRKDGCDGFNIMPPFLPGGLDDFVDHGDPGIAAARAVPQRIRGQDLARESWPQAAGEPPRQQLGERAPPRPRAASGGSIVINVRRLGHATLTTPDIDRQIAYYTEVVGLTLVERSKDRAYLACKLGLEAIALEPGKGNALSRIAFQVAPGTDLGDVSRALAKDGVKMRTAQEAFRRASPRRWCSPT